MKQVLFLLLMLPLFSTAQRTEWDIAYKKSIPGGLGRPIHMPERDYNPHFSFDDTFDYRQKGRVFVIGADSVYRKLFWRYVYTNDSLSKYKWTERNSYDSFHYNWIVQHLIDSLPKVDFSKNELVVYSACAQCFAYCNHEAGEDNCHRNACGFRDEWFIREKKKR